MSDTVDQKINKFVQIRSFLADNIPIILENIKVRKEANKINSEDLFGDTSSTKTNTIKWNVNYNKKNLLDVLIAEKESLGLYVSGNPLERYQKILQWVRETAGQDDIHLILIDKVKKIFTKANKMMFALQISTPNPEEQLEGIIFPKNAINLSPKLEEKKMFWVKANILKNKKKKEEGSELDKNDGMQEYIEMPKLAISNLIKFDKGAGELFANDEIKLPIRREDALKNIDWGYLEHNPKSLNQMLTGDVKTLKTSETSNIKIPKDIGKEKLKRIKLLLKKDAEAGLEEVSIQIETTNGWKSVKGTFWVNIQTIKNIITSVN